MFFGPLVKIILGIFNISFGSKATSISFNFIPTLFLKVIVFSLSKVACVVAAVVASLLPNDVNIFFFIAVDGALPMMAIVEH